MSADRNTADAGEPLIAISYREGDATLRGELALPAGGGPHPGVLVFHSGMGFGDETRRVLRYVAARGYAAFAADMFAANGDELTPEAAGGRMVALRDEPARLRARVAASLAELAARPEVDAERIAAVGFCFGGTCALELARSGAALRAAVSFHGVLSTAQPAAPGAITGQVAVFVGARDPLCPPEQVAAFREEMTQAGVAWQVTEYGEGRHGFAGREPARYDWIRYDPLLEALSWASTFTLFEATLRSGADAAATPQPAPSR